jgi:hypothetical protein
VVEAGAGAAEAAAGAAEEADGAAFEGTGAEEAEEASAGAAAGAGVTITAGRAVAGWTFRLNYRAYEATEPLPEPRAHHRIMPWPDK